MNPTRPGLPGADAMAAPGSGPSPSSGRAASVSGRIDIIGATTFLEKGWSLIAQENYAAAIAALEQAIALHPQNLDGIILLGWANVHEGSGDASARELVDILLRHPENALGRVALGMLSWRKDARGAAAEHFLAALKANSDRKAALFARLYLGCLAIEREAWTEGHEHLAACSAAAPMMVEARYFLGCALWYGGDRHAAFEAWEEAIRVARYSPWAKRCSAALAMTRDGSRGPWHRRWAPETTE